MIKLLAVASLLLSSVSFAGEEPPARIRGTQIDLHFIDHTIAGRIRDRIVYGGQHGDRFGSKVIVRKGQMIAQSSLEKTDDGIVGAIQSMAARRTLKFEFVGLGKEKTILNFKVDGQALVVKVEADDFKNNHFINPTYKVMGPSGLQYQYKIVGGQACYGCSVNLVFMILAAML